MRRPPQHGGLAQEPLGERPSRPTPVAARHDDVLRTRTEPERSEKAKEIRVHRPGNAHRIAVPGEEQCALGVAVEPGDRLAQPLQ